ASGTGGIAYSAAQVAGFFSGNNNTDAFTSTLTSLFVNGANETALVATDPTTLSAFFDTTTYVGAVQNSNADWFARWTCNSSYANFGAGNTGNCTAVPVFS